MVGFICWINDRWREFEPDLERRRFMHAEFEAWLPTVQGKFVAIAFAQPTCRPDADWDQWATEASFDQMREQRSAAEQAWKDSMARAGLEITGRGSETAIARRLESAGAAGVIASRWSRGWGTHQMFAAGTERIPALTAGCEDYGLLYRLAENGQHPVIEVMADSEFLGEGPVFNTIARIPGTELPNGRSGLVRDLGSRPAAQGGTPCDRGSSSRC